VAIVPCARAQSTDDAIRAAQREQQQQPAPHRPGTPETYTVPGARGATGADEPAAGGLYLLQPEAQVSLAGPVDPDVYRVGPGDVLLLQIWGRVSRSVPIEVEPEGTVLLPGSAVVHVAGRTLSAVRADLLARVARQYRGVSMDLRLARPRTFRVYITGQVKKPGPLEANGAWATCWPTACSWGTPRAAASRCCTRTGRGTSATSSSSCRSAMPLGTPGCATAT
jgi:hypothetical protein